MLLCAASSEFVIFTYLADPNPLLIVSEWCDNVPE
jgi:hypothetical protein